MTSRSEASSLRKPPRPTPPPKPRQLSPDLAAPEAPGGWPGGQGVPTVELKSGLLLVGKRPFFPRVIEHRGESFARLKALGFNAVRIAYAPSPEQLAEARGLGMWLVAPPPAAHDLEAPDENGPGMKISTQFDPVLVWDIGGGLAGGELEAARRHVKLVQAADPRRRPILCDPEADVRDYTRSAGILLAHREPLGTMMSLQNYAQWLRDRTQLARPGTPLWAGIQTEPPAQLEEQIAVLSAGRAPRIGIEEIQIRMLVHAALATRARGLCFTSRSRLDGGDSATLRRAAILELVNLELDLIERWPASGNFSRSADTTDTNVTGAVIETDRSRLLMPIYEPPNSQLVMGNTALGNLNFVVTGVPEGNNAYELSPTNFRPLSSKRIHGGTRVALGNADEKSLVAEYDSLVVFTQDDLVIGNLRRVLVKNQQRAARWRARWRPPSGPNAKSASSGCRKSDARSPASPSRPPRGGDQIAGRQRSLVQGQGFFGRLLPGPLRATSLANHRPHALGKSSAAGPLASERSLLRIF